MCNKQFGFRPQHSTALQPALLIERVSRNFDMKKLTGTFFLDVAKDFNTVWVNGLLYKLTIFNFFLYLVKTISSYLHGRFEASFQTATPTCYCMCTGMAQGGIISFVLFSLYVHMPSLLTTSIWLSTQTICLSQPCPASQCCSSNTRRHTSATYRGGWEDGGSPSTSWRALWCSSLRLVGTSQPVQSSGSQSTASIPPVLSAWSSINGWTGQLILSGWKRMRHSDRERLDFS